MKKVLFVGTVLRGHMLVFHLPYMRWFREHGYEVHLCCRNDTEDKAPDIPYCDRYIELPFERSPMSAGNRAVYRELKALIDGGDYSLIHCNTPVGGMLGRLCARDARKGGTRVVYTAHGFHFFKGAPAKNWLLYYPAERFLSRFTDLLITINGEDYARARKFHMKKLALVSGVGVELSRFQSPKPRRETREALQIAPDARVIICVGEHIPRKNHETALRALALIPDAIMLFCGVGELEAELRELAASLGVSERARFLGFRKDVPDLLEASDVFIFPSLQEGLPVSLMEAMAAGLPCAVSAVRGNLDLIGQNDGGTLREPMDARGFAEDIELMLDDESLRAAMGRRNRDFMPPYDIGAVLEQMAALYRHELGERGE